MGVMGEKITAINGGHGRLWSRDVQKHLYWGVVISGYFPGISLWHTRHVARYGHFTLKQLRLPVLNEMHTNSCTGPRLIIKTG